MQTKVVILKLENKRVPAELLTPSNFLFWKYHFCVKAERENSSAERCVLVLKGFSIFWSVELLLMYGFDDLCRNPEDGGYGRRNASVISIMAA